MPKPDHRATKTHYHYPHGSKLLSVIKLAITVALAAQLWLFCQFGITPNEAAAIASKVSNNNVSSDTAHEATLVNETPSSSVAVSTSTPHQPPVWNTSARVCDERPVQLDQTWYKSQSGEDRELQKRFFTDLCKGRYLEIGGLNGVRFSNSFVYNKGLNWTGVLVEASPQSYRELIKNRPNEIANVHAGVCEKEMDLHWVESARDPAVRGFREFAAPSFQKQWWSEEATRNAEVVKCQPLEKILHEKVGAEFYFDFFTLDVEGAELSVLRSINFDLVGFGVIVMEADDHNTTKNMVARELLESNGYVYLEDKSRSSWFRNKDFESIYSYVEP